MNWGWKDEYTLIPAKTQIRELFSDRRKKLIYRFILQNQVLRAYQNLYAWKDNKKIIHTWADTFVSQTVASIPTLCNVAASCRLNAPFFSPHKNRGQAKSLFVTFFACSYFP
jgi:hypothetical protein